MKHVFTSTTFLKYTQRGALLLALGAAAPAAWGQSFGPVTNYSTGANSRPTDVALGDLNGDGRLDIVASLSGTNATGVLLNQPTGGFAIVSSYSTNAAPYGVALGDLNGDGRLDMVTTHYFASTAEVRLGQAGGGFAATTSYSTGQGSTPNKELAVADMNGDGRLDIVTVNVGTNKLGILQGTPTGFAPANNYATLTSGQPQDVAVGDMGGGDGLPEMVVADGSGSVQVMYRTAGVFGTLTNSLSLNPGNATSNLALSDLNGDGRVDIVTANDNTNTIGVFLSQAGNSVTYAGYATGVANTPTSVLAGDVNGDGRPDIIAAYDNTSTIGILLNQANNSFVPGATFPIGAGSGALRLALGDVNGDGRLDIVATNFSTSLVSVFLNTGTYTPLATARTTVADITLAPNPTHDAFTVQLPAGIAPTQAELLNALGQAVRRPAVGAASFRVETSGLAPGVYTLRLLGGGAAMARRVVVE